MPVIDERVIKSLEAIEGDLDSIGLSDSDAWNTVCGELKEIRASLPEEASSVAELLTLCGEGLRGVAGNDPSSSMSLVETVVEALQASKAWLGRLPDADGTVERAGAALRDVLDPDRSPEANGPCALQSLHDAAAFLIQLEPDDKDGVLQLRDYFRTKATDGSLSESVRDRVLRAGEEMDGLLEGDEGASEEILGHVGMVLDALMDAAERVESGEVGAAPESQVPDQPAEPPEAPEQDFYAPDDIDPDLLAEFVTEGRELITKAEEALLTLETDPEDMEAVGMVFRAFHTIKGTAAFLDLSLISEMGHHAESLLSRVRDREIRYTGGYADLALRALDMLKALMQSLEEAVQGAAFLKPDTYDELLAYLADPEEAGISEESDDEPQASPRLGDILVNEGKAVREEVEQLVEAKDDVPLGVQMLRSNVASVSDVAKALRTQRKLGGAPVTVDSSVRVSTERLDRLIDMVGELVVAHSMVTQDETVVSGSNYELLKKVTHTNKIVRELQDMGMSMRMIPLKSTFQKMARLVRDVSRKVGKKVAFVTEGEDTEIDRNMVEVIKDPLVHMVRNAVDHGIEAPEVRVALGKPPHGTVRLAAYHSAGSVIVEIQDDGGGLDREAILDKARRQGLIQDGGNLGDREVYGLVLEPGFSTAAKVTDVSGRGVGMDVVKKNVETLRGQVEINSEPGAGSVFRMRLPLTLAIIDGMVVRVGAETYVVPTVSILRSIKPNESDVSTVLGKGKMLRLQGKLIPLFRLADLFEVPRVKEGESQELVVVVEDDGALAGLLIDELVGRQQIVIKSLGEGMKDVPGIAGGAIMPDGRVGLILDVGGLVKLANSDDTESYRDAAPLRQAAGGQ